MLQPESTCSKAGEVLPIKLVIDNNSMSQINAVMMNEEILSKTRRS